MNASVPDQRVQILAGILRAHGVGITNLYFDAFFGVMQDFIKTQALLPLNDPRLKSLQGSKIGQRIK